ncbi:hypothetical protein RclHR1_03690017 [Rhizophagus clarus]|uniref:Endonuclease/exonuclease/phosphatase domain-containing protein n=1 Tax=Rhizophagus clarus TaxID=94130 RepID=A0A2Z6RNZ8_9GLOM|nr:hypothetical protein RclHR1_03690017 [Rhizophagus clarus]
MSSRKSTRLANKTAKHQPKMVVPVEKPIVIISASSTAPSTSYQLSNQGTSTEGSSITVKKEIMASKAKSTLAEKQAIAKEKALTSNLESERSLTGDLFADKKDGPFEDSADHPVFKLCLDRITTKQVNNSVKKQTTFTCYTFDSNEDAMVTNLPNQEDQQTSFQQVNEKSVIQPEIITISDDEDSFVLVPKLFTIYTESNNLPHVRKTDKAHEVLKLLQHYPGFKYAKPAYQHIRQENGKNKLINIIKAIFSNEDSYNKVLQERFHTKINEEDQDGNIVKKNTTFQFKSAMKETPQKDKEEIDNEKECTIQTQRPKPEQKQPQRKNHTHINNTKSATSHSPNNKPQSQDTNQVGSNNQNNNLSDKQQKYLHSLVDNLVKTLEVQISQQFTELRNHINQFSSMINQFRKKQDERLKNITVSSISGSLIARSPTPSTSSPKNDKNEQNKRVRKDPAYNDSSSSEEEQIENMLHTQRTLVQKVDQTTSGLQGMIEGALQNFLGFATLSTTEQQFIPLEDNEEYPPTDNKEEEADVKTETNVNKNTLRILEHTVQDKFKLYFTIEEKKGTGIGFLVKKGFVVYVQQFQHFEGRIGFIDFYTKKKKICIIQAYINIQNKEKSQVKRLYKQIEHWTNQCLDSFVKDIIIIGDFNTKWNEYEFLDVPHWRYDIFNYFKKYFIKESTSVFCDDISDMYTYIPNNPSHSHNKIDYIWCNIDLMLSAMDSKPHDVQPVIKTDYRMITLDLFMYDVIINKNNTQKRQPPSKTIYCYDEMQKADGEWSWDKFNKYISDYLDDPNVKLTTNKIRGINSQKQLNQL